MINTWGKTSVNWLCLVPFTKSQFPSPEAEAKEERKEEKGSRGREGKGTGKKGRRKERKEERKEGGKKGGRGNGSAVAERAADSDSGFRETDKGAGAGAWGGDGSGGEGLEKEKIRCVWTSSLSALFVLGPPNGSGIPVGLPFKPNETFASDLAQRRPARSKTPSSDQILKGYRDVLLS